MRIKRIAPPKAPPVENAGIDLNLLDPIIEKFSNYQGNLIPLLQATQSLYGFIPRQAMLRLHQQTGLSLSDLYGVATFYAQFRLTPAGKHIIKMCHGTACHVQSVTAITDELLDFLEINDGETTPDGLFTLETVACLGCCSLAPVMMVDEETFGKLSPREAVKIIREIRRTEAQ